MVNVIKAPEGSLYCTEFMKEIPAGIIDKHETGCGLTSLALEDNFPTLVAVPTIEVIKNKVAQYPNQRRDSSVFGYYGGVKDKELMEYLKNVEVPKILVTYDSFDKVASQLKGLEKYRVVVDEFSDLLDAYSYRDKAIRKLLNAVKQFNHVSYISATPMKAEYYPEELKGLAEYKIDWGNYVTVKVERKKTNKPYHLAVNIIEKYKAAGNKGVLMPNGEYSKAAYFFVNSVNSIASIIDSAGLKPSEVKVICSNSKPNQSKLDLFSIGTALDPEKPFNFITSSAFKGCDFYSESGVVYIISNVVNKTTLISIDTDIKQIAGRIRNKENPFNNTIYHIFNTNNSLLSKEEFDNLIQNKIDHTKELLIVYENASEKGKAALTSDWVIDMEYGKRDTKYLFQDSDNSIKFNSYGVINDRRKWEVSSDIYRNGAQVRKAYLKAGFDVDSKTDWQCIEGGTFLTKLISGSFKDLCLQFINDTKEREYIGDRYPVIKEAYLKLGEERMKNLAYRQVKFVEELKFNHKDKQSYLKEEFSKLFTKGEDYLVSDVKRKVAEVYKEAGIDKIGKATDLSNYINTKLRSKQVNGKIIKVIQIL